MLPPLTEQPKIIVKGRPLGGRVSLPVRLSSLALSLAIILQSVMLYAPRSYADFKPLGGVTQIENLSELCNDIQKVMTITQFYQKALMVSAAKDTTTTSGITFSLANNADYIPKICSLMMAVLTARNTEGVLRAARMAARISGSTLETQIDMLEDSIGLYDFATRLSQVKDNRDLKNKILNVNNHARIVNYMQRWYPRLFQEREDEAKRVAAAIDRQSKMTEITTKIFEGCRQTNFAPSDPTKVPTPDEELSLPAALRISQEMEDGVRMRDMGLEGSDKAHKVLNNMLRQIISDPEELESASYILAKFRRESFWLSLGYRPPTSDKKTPPRSKVVPNKAAERGTGDEVRPLDTEKFEMAGVFYVDQGTSDGSQCRRENKPTYEAEVWLINNTNILIDRFIKSRSIADAVTVCPSSPDEAINNTEVLHMAPQIKDRGLADLLAKVNARTVADNCQKFNVKAQAEKMAKLENLGTRNTDFDGMRMQVDKCAPTKEDEIRLKPINYVERENVRTMRQWISHYNERFASWVNFNYQLVLTENPISNSLRDYVADPINQAMTGGRKTSTTAWDPNAARRLSPEQIRFFQDWRQFSFCSIPATLERRYPIEYANAFETKDPEAMATVVRKCEFEETQNAANDRIFEQYFYGMLDSLEAFQEGRRKILKNEIIMGAFRKGANLKNTKSCKEDLKPADFEKAMVQTNTVLFEEIADMYEFMRDSDRRRNESEQQARDEMNKIMNIWEVSTAIRREERARGQLYKNDPRNGETADFHGMMPSLNQQRKIQQREQYNIPDQ